MRNSNLIVILSILLTCYLISGCSAFLLNAESQATDVAGVVPSVDYTDWYGDINDTGVYNTTKWIELDVWFDGNITGTDWSDVTYDVIYEGSVIEADIAVSVEMNYLKCRFDRTFKGVVIGDNGCFEPGDYEICVKDNNGNEIASSVCSVTAESGDTLSDMVTNTERLLDQENQLALRIYFNGDMTPYSKLGFYVVVSLDSGATEYVPEDCLIEPADTYLTVRIFDQEIIEQEAKVSLFCKDGSIVFSE